eukprot:Opistho-2@87038
MAQQIDSTPANADPSGASEKVFDQEGVLGDVVNSVFTAGVNPGVVSFLNYTFAGLFLSLAFLLFWWGVNFHILFMIFCSVGLFASVQWFLANLPEPQQSQPQAQQQPATNTKEDAPSKKKK